MATPNRRYWFSCSDAAEYLIVDSATVRSWARHALDGDPTRLRKAKLSTDGRYFVSRREIVKLLLKSRA